MKHYNNNSGYSIVISLLMVGFLIVVTSWVFNLVLWELNDNRWRENYLKSFAGAEWSLELALLQIKKHGYGYYGNDATLSWSGILAEDPANPKKAKEALVSYDLGSKTKSHSWTLAPLGYAIVPLFFIGDRTSPPPAPAPISTVPDIEISGSNLGSLVWNLLWEDDGISGTGGSPINKDTLVPDAQLRVFATPDNAPEYEFKPITIENFLWDSNRENTSMYMILFNADGVNKLDYVISSSQFFTKPETKIVSSAQVGKYKQNLETELDNTEFLNILRYSIYSN